MRLLRQTIAYICIHILYYTCGDGQHKRPTLGPTVSLQFYSLPVYRCRTADASQSPRSENEIYRTDKLIIYLVYFGRDKFVKGVKVDNSLVGNYLHECF